MTLAILSYLVLTFGDFVLGDFILGDLSLKDFVLGGYLLGDVEFIVCSKTTSSPQTMHSTSLPVHQQQHETQQLVQRQRHGAHSSQQPVNTSAHQAVTTQNTDSIVSAPPGDVNTQTDTSGASIISADTSVNSDSSDDTTQVEIHHQQ